MRCWKWRQLILLVFTAGLITGCANLQAIQDFSVGTSDFANSYDRVYPGTYDTCLTSAEIRNVIIELGETPSRAPLTQLEDDKGMCAPYKPTTKAFSESAKALYDYSQALELVAQQNQSPSFRKTPFIPRFQGIDPNIVDTVPELGNSKKQVELVNQWEPYFKTFFAQKTPQEVILETGPYVDATLELLTEFSNIYQIQLDDYERNITVLDRVIEDTGSSDVIKRTFVINNSRDKDSRQELLKNYNQALISVIESQKRLFQRSELDSPHYSDPIFQQDMQEFLINISNLVQQSKLIAE
ncbi:MAG: hypothetical protein AAF462_02065 [Thermodesulfobacteriota bacterium]